MSERLKLKDLVTKPRAAAALLLSSIALAGCGNTISSNDRSVGSCGSNDYSRAAINDSGKSAVGVLAIAKEDTLTLQERALNNSNSIDVPRYSNNDGSVVEITATTESLTLNFDRSTGLANPRVDHVNFSISGDTVDMTTGVLMCFDDEGKLTTNGTYAALRQYVHQTAPLDR